MSGQHLSVIHLDSRPLVPIHSDDPLDALSDFRISIDFLLGHFTRFAFTSESHSLTTLQRVKKEEDSIVHYCMYDTRTPDKLSCWTSTWGKIVMSFPPCTDIRSFCQFSRIPSIQPVSAPNLASRPRSSPFPQSFNPDNTAPSTSQSHFSTTTSTLSSPSSTSSTPQHPNSPA